MEREGVGHFEAPLLANSSCGMASTPNAAMSSVLRSWAEPTPSNLPKGESVTLKLGPSRYQVEWFSGFRGKILPIGGAEGPVWTMYPM